MVQAPSPSPLHVLMISDVYSPRVNGVSTSIATFRRELTRLGHRVTLIVPQYPAQYDSSAARPQAESATAVEPSATRSEADDGVWRVPAFPVPLDPEDRFMSSRHLRRLRARLATLGCDLIHVQTPFRAHRFGVDLARRLGLPCVETYHTFFQEYLFHYVPLAPRSWMRALARSFSRRQCNRLDRLIVPSRAMLDILRGYGITSTAEVIPTGLQPDQFETENRARRLGDSFRARLGVAADQPLLVHVGRVAHEKNIDFLLRMFVRVKAQRPDARLLIAGEGPAVPSLRRLSQDLGLRDNVLFCGYLDRATDLPACYSAGDAFVFASRTETQGLVVLEAMAVGTPVVSTAYMGTAELLAARRGALVAQDDEAHFAQQVLALVGDAPLRQRLSREAREHAAAWSSSEMAQKLVEAYRRTLAAT